MLEIIAVDCICSHLSHLLGFVQLMHFNFVQVFLNHVNSVRLILVIVELWNLKVQLAIIYSTPTYKGIEVLCPCPTSLI